ncbi:MAG: DUF2934 domain-containing protein [Candidatus Omnitrophica bacterium]|nr:DUF2934 domain-containing protein [Candidatus Omnitrophota bacterium]
MTTLKAKSKTIVHETREDCKTQDHHFVNNKSLIKEIEKKAYELYESRGSVPGFELDDWLEAERIVAAEEEK